MGMSGVAKLFRNGRSQAVRLPKEFRFDGDRVRVRRVPEGVLLQPMIADVKEWFAAMDRIGSDPLFKGGRRQPKAPKRRILFLEGQVRVLEFAEEDARHAGEIRNTLERIGRPIGTYDVLIAGQAISRKLTLVTANTKEFARVKGLVWEDWGRLRLFPRRCH
jgi:predicted nucleic acid-binding protein